MKIQDVKKGTLYNVGNFRISIGTFDDREVAVCSRSTGEFIEIRSIKKGSKAKKAMRKFQVWINNKETLCFSHMQPEQVMELVKLLK